VLGVGGMAAAGYVAGAMIGGGGLAGRGLKPLLGALPSAVAVDLWRPGGGGGPHGGGEEEEVYGEGNLSNLAAIEALEALAE
jgi:hypothetical protein